MSTNGRARSDEPNVATSFSDLTHDVIELAELQAQLFALDIKNTSQKSQASLALAAAGAGLLLGSVPVALLALAELCIARFGWTKAGGYGMAALIGLVTSGCILTAAWMRFRTGLDTLQRSREELRRNVAWIKSTLRTRGQPQNVDS